MEMVLLVNKNYGLLLILCLSLLLFLFLIWESVTPTVPTSYQDAIKHTKVVNIREIRSKITNRESFILYIGRESCPDCQRFAPNLAVAIQKSNKIVYYLDNDSSEKREITEFAREMNIKTVPNLTFYKDGNNYNYLEKGSKASVDEILSFIESQ